MTLEQHPDPAEEARPGLHAVPTADDRPRDPLSIAREALDDAAPGTGTEPETVARPDSMTGPAPGLDWLPDYVEYRSGSLPRLVLAGLFVVTVVAAVVLLFWAVSVSSGTGIFGAVTLGVAAGMLWWAMLAWDPTVISVGRGRLEVARGENVVSVDLRSARTRVDLGLDVRSPRWRTVVRLPGEVDLVIRRRQVDVREFVAVVAAHRRAAGA